MVVAIVVGASVVATAVVVSTCVVVVAPVVTLAAGPAEPPEHAAASDIAAAIAPARLTMTRDIAPF